MTALRPLLVLASLVLGSACHHGSAGGSGSASEAAPDLAPPERPPSASAAPSAAVPSPKPPFESAERFELLIAGGTVVDGSGAKPFAGDVIVHQGRIVHVGRVADSVQAEARIDARGKVVAPGFIDMHSHGDPLGQNQSFLAQGVTTLVVGQDGRSPSEGRLKSWAARVGSRPLALNVAPLAGHGSLRVLAKVGLSAKPSAVQIERMKRLVAEELDAGAWGLSTALEYRPGIFANDDELAAVAEPVAAVDGVVMSHLRSEDDDRIEAAVDELVRQGERSGARVHVAHLKIVYGKGAARADALLAHMARARKRGVALTADAYPYTASYTGIGIVFPDFAKPPHSYAEATRTRRAELEDFLRKRVTRRGGPEATLFGSAPYTGMTLAELARKKNKPFEDVLIDIGPSGASAAYFVMDEATQLRLLLDPHVMIGTDGSAGSRHPRGHGTFARVIAELVAKRRALSIEAAVRKMSGLSAETLGLDRIERGMLRPGWAADVVVFDPAAIEDRASYAHPGRLARGMDWVLVNGRPVIEAGSFQAARRAGKLLLRRR